jgi:hypothetical protein
MYGTNVILIMLVVFLTLLTAIPVSIFVVGRRNDQRRRNAQEKTPARGLKWK